MAKDTSLKSLERRVNILLNSREIPEARMDVVKSLMNDPTIHHQERYRAVIELIQKCPDKKVSRNRRVERNGGKDSSRTGNRKNDTDTEKVDEKKSVIYSDYFSPTETAYYLERLTGNYRRLKLFKRRYLVHRNNRFGIGIRKRLIPSKRLIRAFALLADTQDSLLERLSAAILAILDDEKIEDPTHFNYLRLVRKWLLDTPLVRHRYADIKWMERQHFDREISSYVMNFLSFQKIDPKEKEGTLLQLENKLREMPDLAKEETGDRDTDAARKQKEKGNLAREKAVYDFMLTMRTFFSAGEMDKSPLSIKLKKDYTIQSLEDLLLTAAEVLVFQRPMKKDDVILYYGIQPPAVSYEKWDYSEDYLKKVGKDLESRRMDVVNALRDEMAPYETMNQMIKMEFKGQNILIRSAEEQWKNIDKKHYNVRLMYTDNFFNYLDGLVNYFNNAFIPLIEGSVIYFRDPGRNELEGSVFSPNFFEDDLAVLNNILNEMHYFRSSNPTLAITWAEVKKIMSGQINTMAHVGNFVRDLGDFFYNIGRDLQFFYDLHKTWIFNTSNKKDQKPVHHPIKTRDVPVGEEEQGRPLPYHDCIILGFENSSELTKKFNGKRLLGDNMKEGVFVELLAFSFQTAAECFNERMNRDLARRKELQREIDRAMAEKRDG